MLLGSKASVALESLTLTFQVVAAETAEAYRAIPQSNELVGNIMACFRKEKKNRQVGRRKGGMKLVKIRKHREPVHFIARLGPK